MRWRLILPEENKASRNMAIDEAVSLMIKKGRSPPTIRFYTWNPPAVSIGFFQGIRNEANIRYCKKRGVDIVRRKTGGGAVYHDKELTYSIIAPLKMFSRDIKESYKDICNLIVEGLKDIGVAAEFSPINDVLVGNKKISGSAQTRTNGVLLQHGTILYDVDVDEMFRLLSVGKAKVSDKLVKSVKKRVTWMKKEKSISFEEMSDKIIKAFCKGKDIEEGGLTEDEKNLADSLEKERYLDDRWTFMR